MCLHANEVTPATVQEFWKKAGNTAASVEQHRICCIYKDSLDGRGGAMGNGHAVGTAASKDHGDKKSYTETSVRQKRFRKS